MNKLIEDIYVLHLWWGSKNKKILNILKYLTLPIIYLLIVIIVVPSQNVLVNEVNAIEVNTYKTIAISKEEKIDYILKEYNLSKYQFKVLSAIVLSEADNSSYEDTYAVINTIYNRTHSKAWVHSVNSKFGVGKGTNLYYQAISPNQFTVYQSGSYLRHLNNTTSVGYDAIIDFLYTEDIMHNYLSFRAHTIKVNNSESFSDNGNNYFNILKEENRI